MTRTQRFVYRMSDWLYNVADRHSYRTSYRRFAPWGVS